MDQKIIERDLREEMAYFLQIQQDANLRGGEVDLKIAHFAAKHRRHLQDQLLDLWDGESRKAIEQSAVTFANEKKPTGVGASRLHTNIRTPITEILTRNEVKRNACIS